MTVGLSFCGFQYNGFLVNHLDLAPPFAGLLMGMGNAIGTTARFWQRYFHGVITSTSEVANNYKSTQFGTYYVGYLVIVAEFHRDHITARLIRGTIGNLVLELNFKGKLSN